MAAGDKASFAGVWGELVAAFEAISKNDVDHERAR